MKKLSFLLIISFLFSCKNQAPNSAISVNQEALDANGSTMLIGRCTRGAFMREPYKNWFETNYSSYTTKKDLIAGIKPKINDYSITIFLGTWCGDSRQEVPRMMKILDESGYKKAVKFILVDNDTNRYKQSPTHEEQGKDIFRVPTFIIERNGVEVNRIIESPVVTLEKDLSDIISNLAYEPSYQAVLKVIEILKNKGRAYLESNYSSISEELKALSPKSNELNSYGYVLLGTKNFQDAIAVFTLQTHLFPTDANSFDSLAEAYLLAGKKKLAIQNYEKAIKINPNFESSVNMLKKLKG